MRTAVLHHRGFTGRRRAWWKAGVPSRAPVAKRRTGVPDSIAGFSVVETLIAAVLFAIAFVFFFQMLFSGRTLVQFEADRRTVLKLAQHKIEDLMLAGYYSSGDDSDWTSLNLDVGEHPPKQGKAVIIDDMGTVETADDFLGAMSWVVRDTAWSWSDVSYAGPPIQVNAKVIRLTVEWPEDAPRDAVSLTTILTE